MDITTRLENISVFGFDREYDLIVAIAVLHFLPEAQVHRVLQSAKAHTKPLGLNVISVFTEENPLKGFPKLFKKLELARAYEDWEILEYEEKLTPWERHGMAGELHRHAVAELIARQPEPGRY